MKLYEFVALYHPKKEKGKDRQKSKLIVDVQRVIADTEDEVKIIAARAIPDEYTNKLDRVELAVRPF